MNVFNTVKNYIFVSTSPIHITETSGAVTNYPVDQKYRMLLNQGFYFRVKETASGPSLKTTECMQILEL